MCRWRSRATQPRQTHVRTKDDMVMCVCVWSGQGGACEPICVCVCERTDVCDAHSLRVGGGEWRGRRQPLWNASVPLTQLDFGVKVWKKHKAKQPKKKKNPNYYRNTLICHCQQNMSGQEFPRKTPSLHLIKLLRTCSKKLTRFSCTHWNTAERQ